MTFNYSWKNKEANYGPPLEQEVTGGTHITCDILLKKDDQYFVLRRKNIPGHEAPPDGNLFLCHDLIRYGESIDECVTRIVLEQSGAAVLKYEIVDLRSVTMKESGGKEIEQWALIPFFIAEVESVPTPGVYGNEVTEVLAFTKDAVPKNLAWGKAEIVSRLLN